jgi:hypothetical protein
MANYRLDRPNAPIASFPSTELQSLPARHWRRSEWAGRQEGTGIGIPFVAVSLMDWQSNGLAIDTVTAGEKNGTSLIAGQRSQAFIHT